MSGCEDGDLRHRGWDVQDPHALKDQLNRVTFFFDTAADAFWHSLAGENGHEVLKARMKAKMYLAKYAHISPFEWEKREVTELHEHFAALSEMIRETKGNFAED